MLVSGEVIGGGLSREISADGVGTARPNSTGLGWTVLVFHGHNKNQTNKVDVRDVYPTGKIHKDRRKGRKGEGRPRQVSVTCCRWVR